MSKRSKIRVVPSITGTKDSIQVDGVDLAPACRGYRLDASVGNIPTLTVDLALFDGEIDGEAVVIVPTATHDALIALGWTPPE